ncbi:hypothetical protein Q8A73_015969 [Channa argus]|nr:hypothetical protein Q8A73_015969 [Channa argus]
MREENGGQHVLNTTSGSALLPLTTLLRHSTAMVEASPHRSQCCRGPGPEHNPGHRVPARLLTNMPAQHNTHQPKAEHRRGEQPHSQDRGRNTGWQAFCLHMRRINPHSGSHLYSFIGLWCLLNQSVKGWPDGANRAHPPQ